MGGQGFAVQLIVADNVDRLAFGKESGIFTFGSFAENSISELDDRATQERRAGFDEDLVVVASRRAIAAAGIDDGKDAVVIDLKLAVGEAERAKEFDAPDLKPYQVVGIVDDAHLVGFSIADANFCDDWHSCSGQWAVDSEQGSKLTLISEPSFTA
jgi:hypothetical protein